MAPNSSERQGGAVGSPGEQGLPVLPITWRPSRTRAIVVTVAVLMACSMSLVAALLPSDGGAPWPLPDRIAFGGVGFVAAAVLCVLARPKVVADRGGLTVVNMLRTHRLEWPQIVRVNLRPGDPWVLLDLDSGETLPAMGIQPSNGPGAALQAVADLRSLVELYSYTGRGD
ncbi:PH domain-containing protein [Actinocrinis puniceicyclus]|uniref:PH domain-containing protein n=1 Tax=Actinocrinis puniceicyclus TaxID=977794 RepID=A0A8J7WTE1_9ACTN|nr:PH domain-containing protein [Actinocrinis puniceicyclus]MBS2966132.1 PH domain-containing protein [Actinocrinis puniceicyclus]